MKAITIIPARGNSKRLPNKNILELNGIPLIAHSINYAKANSHISDSVYVTTDNEAIKNIALKLGAKVIDRPVELSTDNSTTVSAIKHALLNINIEFDVVILLQPTNPLRPKNLLEDAFNIFKEKNCVSLMTVSKNEKKLGKIVDGNFEPHTYKMGQRSQDLEPLYFENGLLYISKKELILEDKILDKKNMPYIVNHPYAKVDIDTAEDFNYAEFILKNYLNE